MMTGKTRYHRSLGETGIKARGVESAGAVRLEHGMFRRSKQRWNRWFGRIVLIQQVEAGTVYTVKVHGEAWTLKSFCPVLGALRPSKAWDDVNIVVDPQAVELSIAAPCYIVRQS